MRIIEVIIYWILVFCLPILIITGTIRCMVGEVRLYEYGFDKYQISQATGVDETELKEVAYQLTGYFDLKLDSAQVVVVKEGEELNLFNERELIHLWDIRNLIQLDHWIQRVAFTVIIISGGMLVLLSAGRWRMLVRGLLWGSICTLGLMVILALWALFGFDQLFLLFHLVSFPNEFWMLNPRTDYLIALFPEAFFYDVAMFGFGAIIFQALLVGGVAFGISRSAGKNCKRQDMISIDHKVTN